ERAGKRRGQRLTAVAAIGAGIRHDPDLDCSQRAVTEGAQLHLGGHRMARRGADELFSPRKFPFYRPRGLQRREQAKILGQHLLLAAEPTTDTLGENVHVAGTQAKDMTELLLGNEWRLRTGPDMRAPVRRGPGDGTMRLEMHVLDARRGIDALMHD